MTNFITATLILFGLAAAGSEGPYFPTVNLVGGLIALAAVKYATRRPHHG